MGLMRGEERKKRREEIKGEQQLRPQGRRELYAYVMKGCTLDRFWYGRLGNPLLTPDPQLRLSLTIVNPYVVQVRESHPISEFIGAAETVNAGR